MVSFDCILQSRKNVRRLRTQISMYEMSLGWSLNVMGNDLAYGKLQEPQMTNINRRDFHIQTRDGVSIAIREVKRDGASDKVPMILLHGTRIPGLSEFDLPVENGSLAADMAAKGHVCYIVDARGFGRSERPAEMEEPPKPYAKSLARSIDITRDIDAKHLT